MIISARLISTTLALLGAAFRPSPMSADGPGSADNGGVLDVTRIERVASRGGRAEEAIRDYLAAADNAPDVADWLILRAAALSRDSLRRAELYLRIRSAPARARILATEARAREESGDIQGAAARYDSLGLYSDATRLRLKMAWTDPQRLALRGGLLAVIRQERGRPEAVRGIGLMSELSVVLTPQEALDAAHLATQLSASAAAAPLYARAISTRAAGPRDILTYGNTLITLRKYRDAIRVFGRLRSDSTFGTQASFGQAWAMARLGQTSRAMPALDQLLARAPNDTLVRPRALFLAGNLAWQRGDRNTARDLWSELLRRFPGADSTGRAGFLAALTLYEEGRITQAAEQWERVHLLNGRGDGLAAGYWAGRAWSETGDPKRAEMLWQSVIARDSSSYYAVLSARRLNVAMWRPEPALERFADYPDVDSAMVRLRTLRALGMNEEAGYEISSLSFAPGDSVERVLSIADALRSAGEPSAAVAAARRALGMGARPDTRTYRLLYPRHFEEDVESHASEAGLDPFLVAALIRQESSWEARARSRVGAVGLMQVMPRTARLIARALRVRGWHSDQLYEPTVNLRFGTWYLAQSLRQFGGDVPRALAAYNAGGNRIGTWASGAAARDSELFVERIDFRETRDYVRIIQRNLELYRVLYGAPAGGAP